MEHVTALDDHCRVTVERVGTAAAPRCSGGICPVRRARGTLPGHAGQGQGQLLQVAGDVVLDHWHVEHCICSSAIQYTVTLIILVQLCRDARHGLQQETQMDEPAGVVRTAIAGTHGRCQCSALVHLET